MCSLELDPCDVWREEHRKARKQHRCASCGCAILPGTKYLSHFSVFEGDPTTEAICGACEADRKVFADAHGQFMAPGSFPRMLDDCISEGDPDSAQWELMRKTLNERRQEAR